MKHVQHIFALLFLILIVTGCNTSNENEQDSTKPSIYTTVYPLQFLVEQIAGDTVNVISVYPPGVDEHTYEPTAKEVTQIADGIAFFYIGAGLEALASTAADALENQTVQLIEIGQHEEIFISATSDEHEDEHHHHSDIDPHVWLDPLRMNDIAEIVKDELVTLFPQHEKLFSENVTQLKSELTTLHEEYAELIASKTNKHILVTHAAFGYWEEQYGIKQIPIHGLSTENEPSQKELITIIHIAEEYEIDYIIFEQNITTKTADIIQDEINAESLIIHNLAVRTEKDITENRDYLSIMRDNLQVLNEALKE